MGGREAIAAALVVAAGLAGVGVGYVVWGWPTDWYRARPVEALPAGEKNELVRYGWELVIDTAAHIGKSAADPAKRYAGNDLACGHCHMNAGLRAYAMPFVSTVATFPTLAGDTLMTLPQRVNQCMQRSMNGSPLPDESREMQAFIAYLEFLGDGAPEGVRLPGMGLYPMPEPNEPADATRGEAVYREHCALCHGENGEGQRHAARVGYSIPPLWGGDSFNATAGLNALPMAAAFIHANMPVGADRQQPLISIQQAWDVAAFMTTRPRPPGTE